MTKTKSKATKKQEDSSKKAAKILAVRKARITREYNRLIKLFENNSDEKKHVIRKLCARASFLLILSEDIEKDINNDTLTVLTINANQQFVKSNPLLKDYRDTVKSYQTVVKQLCDLCKNSVAPSSSKLDSDELEEFMNT